jgi:hypothetical protein
MAVRRVILEMRDSRRFMSFAAAPSPAAVLEAAPALATEGGLKIDPSFAPMPMPPQVPEPTTPAASVAFAAAFALMGQAPETYLVRGEMEEAAAADLAAATASNPDIVGIYADMAITTFPVCPGSPPQGTDQQVADLLGAPKLQGMGMDGTGVYVAVVDTGINLPWLNSKGKTPNFDAGHSFTTLNGTPGNFPKNHGTMCAFDVCIAAPRCTLLDIAILNPMGQQFQGLLSDAVRAYGHLLNFLRSQIRPGGGASLVVTNSWGRFPSIPDFPPGSPSNYSDNPNHPFNRIVDTLESFGADILFAAGNCGPVCPDNRCNNITNDGIYGANSHPKVLSIGGVDVNGVIAGYSTNGPGRLDKEKPDVCSYTHFKGSDVYPADGGTSAATPVAAGLVAAVRTKKPSDPQNPSASPQALRSAVTKTATHAGPAAFDYAYGWGIVNGSSLANLFGPPKTWTTFLSASLDAGQTGGWYSAGWSGKILVDWRVVPKGASQPDPQLTLVWRWIPQPDGTVMYTFDVTNNTAAKIDFDLQYGR